MKVEHVDFIGIPTRDVARAKRFFGETLELPLEKDSDRWAEFRAGQITLGIWNPEQMGRTFTRSSSVALRVADVAAARAELEARGVEFDGDTIDTGVCHMAPFRDPDGNTFMLHHRYAP